MNNIFNIIKSITNIAKYLGFVTMTLMMLLLTIGSFYRTIGNPILGDVEISSLLMVILIFCAIPYTQSKDGHIKIGILVDRLSRKTQKILDIISSSLSLIVATIIAIVYFQTSIRYMENPQYSDLLNIPLAPFQLFILISAILWGLECVLKLAHDIFNLVYNNNQGEER